MTGPHVTPFGTLTVAPDGYTAIVAGRNEIVAWTATWPCSGMRGLSKLEARFDPAGDIVDLQEHNLSGAFGDLSGDEVDAWEAAVRAEAV